jgi:hypothetical protein
MLGNAFFYAAGAGLKGIQSHKRIETSAASPADAKEPIGPDAVDRLHLSGNMAIFEKLGHYARAFPGIDLQCLP